MQHKIDQVIEHHLYIHQNESEILHLVKQILEGVIRMDSVTQAKLDNLAAKVAAETEVESSIITLLNGLSAQIAELKKGVTDPAVLAAIDAAADIVAANTTKMSDAVVANTPSVP